MSGIGSRLRSRWPEIALVGVSALNVVAALFVREWEIVPFHLVWASLALIYGLRVWTVWGTAAVLVAIIAVTGLPLLYTVTSGVEPVEELSEVPLISAIFAAMLWHAHRYQSAMAEVRRLADSEHRLLERQREFVRDASHELKTPITVASGHAELILRSSDPQAAADADVVLDELTRLSRLAERLLLLAATDHPDFLSVEPIELGPFLKMTLGRWQATAERTVAAIRLAPEQVKAESSQRQRPRHGRRGGLAEPSSDASYQFANGERLGEVVRGTEIETLNPRVDAGNSR
jgi:two-component system OmpR family sensor kinase